MSLATSRLRLTGRVFRDCLCGRRGWTGLPNSSSFSAAIASASRAPFVFRTRAGRTR
jgi:hypothetical protein